jgi:hypothetical protein
MCELSAKTTPRASGKPSRSVAAIDSVHRSCAPRATSAGAAISQDDLVVIRSTIRAFVRARATPHVRKGSSLRYLASPVSVGGGPGIRFSTESGAGSMPES